MYLPIIARCSSPGTPLAVLANGWYVLFSGWGSFLSSSPVPSISSLGILFPTEEPLQWTLETSFGPSCKNLRPPKGLSIHFPNRLGLLVSSLSGSSLFLCNLPWLLWQKNLDFALCHFYFCGRNPCEKAVQEIDVEATIVSVAVTLWQPSRISRKHVSDLLSWLSSTINLSSMSLPCGIFILANQ